jgi:hypothetical protein
VRRGPARDRGALGAGEYSAVLDSSTRPYKASAEGDWRP